MDCELVVPVTGAEECIGTVQDEYSGTGSDYASDKCDLTPTDHHPRTKTEKQKRYRDRMKNEYEKNYSKIMFTKRAAQKAARDARLTPGQKATRKKQKAVNDRVSYCKRRLRDGQLLPEPEQYEQVWIARVKAHAKKKKCMSKLQTSQTSTASAASDIEIVASDTPIAAATGSKDFAKVDHNIILPHNLAPIDAVGILDSEDEGVVAENRPLVIKSESCDKELINVKRQIRTQDVKEQRLFNAKLRLQRQRKANAECELLNRKCRLHYSKVEKELKSVARSDYSQHWTNMSAIADKKATNKHKWSALLSAALAETAEEESRMEVVYNRIQSDLDLVDIPAPTVPDTYDNRAVSSSAAPIPVVDIPVVDIPVVDIIVVETHMHASVIIIPENQPLRRSKGTCEKIR